MYELYFGSKSNNNNNNNSNMDVRKSKSVQRMLSITAASMTRSKNGLENVYAVVRREHTGTDVRVLNELLTLDEAYRIYFKEWQRELGIQRIAATKLWPLTRDLSIQAETKCRPPQPRNYSATDSLVSNYQMHYQIILGSNLAMMVGLSAIRKNLLLLRREYAGLDLTESRPLITGDKFHKPIKFFMDLVEELFKYFYSYYLQLDCGAHHLDPYDLDSVEKYQKMLEPCEEFDDYLLQNLSYCHCLRPPVICPTIPTPQPLPTDLKEAQRRAIHNRCRRRLAKMSCRSFTKESVSFVGELPKNDPMDLEHEFRMNQLSMRLAQLHEHQSENSRRDLVSQMIRALSPSLVS